MHTSLSPSPSQATRQTPFSMLSMLPLDPPLARHPRSGTGRAIHSKYFNQYVSTVVMGVMSLGVLVAGQTAALAKSDFSQMEAESALHLVCVKEAQHFICQPDASSQPVQGSTPTNTNQITATMQPQVLTSTQQEWISNLLIGMAYLLPVGLGLGIFMYDRYMRYRATLLQHHIETLERIWQQNQNLQR